MTRSLRRRFRGISIGVRNCAREVPTASIHGHGDASVFGPNDTDRRGAPVLSHEPLQFEATTITRAHPGSCMTRIRGLPASFGISKPIAERMTTAFAETPSITAASQSRTVGPSTAPRTTLSARAAANHKPVVNPSAVAAPLPRSSCAAGVPTAVSAWRYGQGAV